MSTQKIPPNLYITSINKDWTSLIKISLKNFILYTRNRELKQKIFKKTLLTTVSKTFRNTSKNVFKALDKFIRPHRKITPKQQRPIHCSWTNTKKRWPFHQRGLRCKRSQETPGVKGKFGLEVQNEARQRLTEFCQENAPVIANTLPTTQEMILHMKFTRWSIPKSDWLYSLQLKMEKLHTVNKNKTWRWLWLRPWAPYCQIQT